MAAKFNVGNTAYAWDYFGPAGPQQITGQVVAVLPPGHLSNNQTKFMYIIEEKTMIGQNFLLREETHLHKKSGQSYADDPDNQQYFARFREEASANTIQRKHPKL